MPVFVGGVLEVGDKGFFQGCIINALGPDTRQAVDRAAIGKHLGIGDGQAGLRAGIPRPDRVAVLWPRLALGPVTGRQAEQQHLGQAMGIQLRLDVG